MWHVHFKYMQLYLSIKLEKIKYEKMWDEEVKWV